MNCLYLILFIFFSQNCSQLGRCLQPADTNFFTPYLFRNIGANGSFNCAAILSNIKAFDFKEISNLLGHDYEGVVIYHDETSEFMQRTSDLTGSQGFCKCSTGVLCKNCTQFKQKLRNGVFYGGDYRVYRQDKEGNVFVDQWSPQGKRLTTRFLFKNFKKIIQVQTGKNGKIVFLTENTMNSSVLPTIMIIIESI